MGLETIKRPADFHRVRGGARVATPAFVIETKARQQGDHGATRGPRIGITITRKLGGAVVRNRIRRRLQEIFRAIVSRGLLRGQDYVVVARPPIIEMPFAVLVSAIEGAIDKLHGASRGGHGQRPGLRGRKDPESAGKPDNVGSRDRAPRTCTP